MTFEQYMKFVDTGVILDDDTYRERLILGGLGIVDEGGEVAGLVKKVAFHGQDMDREKLVKELGDVLWYYALMLRTNDITLNEVMEKNVFKLCERYPDQYGEPYKWLGAVRPQVA